ncbi:MULTISPECIES: PEGA domain-containing protein [Psychrilyobacter]|uniref:PEGA domain-containing protein n=1 Tax=Psychrilyobacter piezotolerans TaxID=2293438 RepID=A0ABX9KFE9_9FUSO|nr:MULTISPECIES: PEGA domain-containing protein [Psychrilyobacter]MCS5422161.1 PEGA domain-containing protein [Psychrilyobacter sp. S5]NDI78517.1 PEGA domain-containing protein [Psychrilyobacter piezotolerans]RDE60473.1 PEGA domain-containing protein [Psychrilyobacter sp. S5]REI40503.1 PEGA domain-containing protein [Psychrilyobacter piezotolerans]
MKKILWIMILGIFYGQLSFSDAYIKLMSDQSGSDIYVDGEIAGTYDELPLEFILPAGKYLLEVKNENGDGSYGYYSKTLKVGKIDIKVPINAILEKKVSRGILS